MSNTIYGFTPSAEQVLTINASSTGRPTPAFQAPGGITLDGAGRIYVADGHAGAVTVFDPSGEQLFGPDASPAFAPEPRFGSPLRLGSDGSDTIYVIDNAGSTGEPTLYGFFRAPEE